MKLIDLLVQELPKLGGWPEGAGFIAADEDGDIDSYVHKPHLDLPSKSWVDHEGGGYHEHNVVKAKKVCDWNVCVISEEQYESAVAASKQVEWDGLGMPPVGCECGARKKSPGEGWWNFKVEHISSGCIFGFWIKSGQGAALDCDEYDFMPLNPIRTEAARRRENCCDKIFGAMCKAERKDNRSDMAEAVYDAIAAGKIPGIKLAD
ncbi:MAG: hypothetical protein [Caudoviricetes sp.]|nr:MAG: hypothetical protein [Caudoviricetes sp.]